MENIMLDYFIEVGKELNITKAAENCHVTQQNLSAYVKKLENLYDVQLLERKPKLKLTAAGEVMYAAALEIRKIYEKLEKDLNELEENKKMSVTIGVHTPVTALIRVFPLGEFSAFFPHASISIVPGYYRDLSRMLKEREIDMLLHVGTVERPQVEVTPEFTYRRVLEDRKCIAISRDLLKQCFQDRYEEVLEKEGTGTSILDFSDVPMVIHPARTGMIQQLKQFFNRNHKHLNIFTEGATPAIQNTFVVNGLGMCLSSLKIARLEFKDHPEVLLFPITDPELSQHNIELIHRTEAVRPDAEGYMLVWMEEKLPKLI